MQLRDTPCDRCGWKFPGFHICVDLSRTCEEEGLVKPKRVRSAETEQSRALRESNRLRREAARLLNAERDQKMVELYKQFYGYKDVSEEFGVPYTTTVQIIQRAAARGEVELRPRGSHASKLRAGGADGGIR